MDYAYIFLGSNIDREKNYLDALSRLNSLGRLIAVSSVYDTKPVGGEGGNFYNGAALLETPLSAHPLKRALRKIEAEMGRVRTGDPNAPRPIDLDLALFNHDWINTDDLQIPDPLIVERPFMAAALAELEPQYVHPSNGLTLEQISERLAARRTNHMQREMNVDAVMTARAKIILNESYTGEVTHA
jgi:2-amino-4-hydroxy-6-hydroxymethyldihydropteridine diphosphokinase